MPRQAGDLRIGWAVPGTPVDQRAQANHAGRRALAQGGALRVGEVFLLDMGAGAELGRFRVDLLGSDPLDPRY